MILRNQPALLATLALLLALVAIAAPSAALTIWPSAFEESKTAMEEGGFDGTSSAPNWAWPIDEAQDLPLPTDVVARGPGELLRRLESGEMPRIGGAAWESLPLPINAQPGDDAEDEQANAKKIAIPTPEERALELKQAFEAYRQAAERAGVPFQADLEARFAAEYERKVKVEHEKLEPSLNSLASGAIAVFIGVLALAGYAFVRTFILARRLAWYREVLEERGVINEAEGSA